MALLPPSSLEGKISPEEGGGSKNLQYRSLYTSVSGFARLGILILRIF
jgi:hypothetical protein